MKGRISFPAIPSVADGRGIVEKNGRITRWLSISVNHDYTNILKRTELEQNLHMDWHPATIEEVRKIVRDDLAGCDAEQFVAFKRYEVEPYVAPILRYGEMESVVVVARRDNEVIYWEDVEEGFNVSPVAPDGRILEHWCNQDELQFVLNAWIEERARPIRLGPTAARRT